MSLEVKIVVIMNAIRTINAAKNTMPERHISYIVQTPEITDPT
jgi:hypothetical protein